MSDDRHAYPPFDPAKCQRDDAGREVRFIRHPLDRTYLAAPYDDLIPGGMLPPEELEVRWAATALRLLQIQLNHDACGLGLFGWLIGWLSPSPTADERRARVEAEQRLRDLVARSPEHQAAAHRMITSMPSHWPARAALVAALPRD
jgi:hypothetical protein